MKALVALVLGWLLAVPAAVQAAQPERTLVFAAASLKGALDKAAAAYRTETGVNVTISYAGSNALAKQIEQGAPAQIFISADEAWMDYLAERDLLRADTRVDLLSNELVLIAPTESKVALTISQGFALADAIGDGRLAMADPVAVPAGKYAKAALMKLGVWEAVSAKVARAENVRAALALVARGEAPLGIVYRTDALAEPRVREVGTFPPETHDPILYPAALTVGAAGEADHFLAFLQGPTAMTIFGKAGFGRPGG